MAPQAVLKLLSTNHVYADAVAVAGSAAVTDGNAAVVVHVGSCSGSVRNRCCRHAVAVFRQTDV